MSGKSPSTVKSTETSSKQVAPYVEAAQQNLLDSGQSMLGGFAGLAPQNAVAGFGADALAGFDLSRGIAQDSFSGGASQAPGFASAAYLAANPDVAADPTYANNAQGHYNAYGRAEGRAAPTQPLSDAQSTMQAAIARGGAAPELADFEASKSLWKRRRPQDATAQQATAQGYEAAGYTGSGYTADAYGSQGYGARNAGSQGYAAQNATSQGYDPRLGTAEQVTGSEIQSFLNPYTQSVVDTTLNTMGRQRDVTAANNRARSAAAGSFGGSRQALQAAELDRSFGDQAASTTAQLMSQGYDRATATALSNAGMRQQTGLANQNAANTAFQFGANAGNVAELANTAAGNRASEFGANAINSAELANMAATNRASEFGANASNAAAAGNAAAGNAARAFGANATNQSSQFNVGAQNTASAFGANALNNTSQFNTGQMNAVDQFNVGQQNARDAQNAQTGASLFQNRNANNLAAYTAQNAQANTVAGLAQAARSGDANQQLQAVRQLLANGVTQQQLLQAGINVPTAALQQLAGIVPKETSSTSTGTTTKPNTAPGIGQQLLGAGLSLGSKALLGGLMCDVRLKRDIAPYGADARGRPLFTFRYAWDDDSDPVRIGPMAQIEEAHDPDSVIDVLGFKMVKRVH